MDETPLITSSNRKTTDCLFLILLLLNWITMSIIGLSAVGMINSKYTNIPQGNPATLVYGIDYQGHICSVDKPVQSLHYIYEPNLLGYLNSNIDNIINNNSIIILI